MNNIVEQRRIVAYLDSFPLSRDLRQARLASLRELQSQAQEELDALSSSLAKHPERASVASGIPSVLDGAFISE